MYKLPSKIEKQGDEVKRFLESLGIYLKLESVEKLAQLFSSLIWIFVFILLLFAIVFFLTRVAICFLEDWLGSYKMAALVCAGFFALCVVIVGAFRTKIILNPMTRILIKIFFDDKPKVNPTEKKEETNRKERNYDYE